MWARNLGSQLASVDAENDVLAIHEEKNFAIMHYLETWQHCLGFHKAKVLTKIMSLKCFEIEVHVTAKPLRWHDVLDFMNVHLIHIILDQTK